MPRWENAENKYKESIPVPHGWKCPIDHKPGYPFWVMIPRASGKGFKGPYIYVFHGSENSKRTQCYVPRNIEKTLHLPPPMILSVNQTSTKPSTSSPEGPISNRDGLAASRKFVENR
jgi:hypothetical protein